MSTQQILGVVGAVVGWYFGYPQLGFVVGSLVGAALTPKQKTEGPRLDDLKVTVSTYGAGIPTVYGTSRVGGNVIWSTDKIELSTTTSTGKGGGVENTSYKAFVHMAVALCYGEIVGIRKVWKDGKLIYDSSSGISIEAAFASAESPYSFATLYLGTETQLPDPIQQIYLGAGNAPAYRGMAYIQLNAIECPGGRVPQFSFEVTTNATSTPTLQYGTPDLVPDVRTQVSYSRAVLGDSTTIFLEHAVPLGGIADNKRIDVYALGLNYATKVASYPTDLAYNYTRIGGVADIDMLVVRQVLAVDYVDTDVNRAYLADGTHKLFTPGFRAYGQSTSRFAKRGNRFVLTGDTNQLSTDAALFNWESTERLFTDTTTVATDVALTDSYLWLFTDTQVLIRSVDDPYGVLATTTVPVDFNGADLYFAPQPADQLHVFANTSGSCAMYMVSFDGTNALFTLIGYVPFDVPSIETTNGTSIAYGGNSVVGVASVAGDVRIFLLRLKPLDLVAVDVADIIEAQCLRAGLSAGQVDVSTIADTVHGYTIANPASARTNIQPLMTAYGIDAREEDGQIEFFKRSAITSVVTVPYVELGCVEGEGNAGDPLPLSHGQEAELPRAINVNYINPDFDYQTGTERSERQVTESQLDQTIDMPIGTNSTHAASVAQMILYDAWNERNKRSLKVSRKYAAVSAGDGVSIEYPEGTTQRWRLTKVTDTGALCEWEVVPADESIYTQTAPGAGVDASQAQVVAPLSPPTRAVVVETSLLRDSDNAAGVYVAMDGYGPGWDGGELLIGNNAGSVEPRGAVASNAPIGIAETVLGDWTHNLVDETNLVTVDVVDDTLSSITRDLMLSGTSNVAALGAPGRWEIIKFQRADSLGSGRYILSGLLRGLKGTEHARASHAIGDTFVLMLPAGLLNPGVDVGSIGQSQAYLAVSKGRTTASGVSQTYVSTGEALTPYSPVNARAERIGTDITLTWDRRSRLSDNVTNGSIPLGEASEAYSVDLFTSGSFAALAGTLTSYTSSMPLSSAQQTSFGLTPGGTVYARIYQVSDSVGRGHVLQATL